MIKKITVEDAIHHLLETEQYDWFNSDDIEMLQFVCKLAEDSAKAQGILTMDFNEAIHCKQIGATRYLRNINGRVEYITNETYKKLKEAFDNGSTHCVYADSDIFKEGVFPLGKK